VVDRALLTPGQVEAHGDHDLGLQAAERGGQVTAQGQAVLDEAVHVIEEVHVGDADDRGAALLLGHAQRPDLGRGQAGDARFPAGGQQVGHLLALTGPAGDSGRGAVLEIVGMGHDGDGAGPVLGHGLQAWHGYLRHGS